jgi:hypothetical protein
MASRKVGQVGIPLWTESADNSGATDGSKLTLDRDRSLQSDDVSASEYAAVVFGLTAIIAATSKVKQRTMTASSLDGY